MASATTVMSDWAPMSVVKPMRTTGWSSATRTRIIEKGLPRSGFQRYRHPHFGAGAGLALQGELSAQLLGALAHTHDTEVSGLDLAMLAVEPAAVVLHPQTHRALAD